MSYYLKYLKYKKKYLNLKNLTGGAYNNVIKIDEENLDVFKQEEDLCWIHTAIVVLFFSDCFRDVVWNASFNLQKVSKNIIPIRTKIINDNDKFKSFFWYFICDIIRNVINNLKTKGELSKTCNQILQKIICSTNFLKSQNSSDLKQICDFSFGGYSTKFFNNFIDFYNIRNKFEIAQDIKMDQQFSQGYISLIEGLSVIVLYTNSHVMSFQLINKKWYFFDNERDKTLLDINTRKVGDKLLKPKIIEHLFKNLRSKDNYYENLWEQIEYIDLYKIKPYAKNVKLNLFKGRVLSEYDLKIDLFVNSIIEYGNKEIAFYCLKLFIEEPLVEKYFYQNKKFKEALLVKKFGDYVKDLIRFIKDDELLLNKEIKKTFLLKDIIKEYLE